MSRTNRVTNIAEAKREVVRLKQDLDDTYNRYQSAMKDIPINFHGDVHRYLCIRLAGYIEQLYFTSITGFIKSSHNPKVVNFALSHFRYAPNMKPNNLEELIMKFGDEWSADLKIFLDDQNRRDNLGNLLAIRNTTAHGGNYSGTMPQVVTYKQLVDDLYNWALRTILA